MRVAASPGATSPGFSPGFRVVIAVVFFLVCCGLGYPTLNRYDARQVPGTWDANVYYDLVVRGPSYPPRDIDHRLLIPWLARPIYRAADHHVGTWDPVFFALLVVNSLFAAAAAYLILRMAQRIGAGALTGLLAALLFLGNFSVGNMHLAGVVDAAEVCFLTAALACMQAGRWWMLPLVAIGGAAAKETFVPLALAMAAGWLVAQRPAKPEALRLGFWIAVMTLAGLATVTGLMSVVWQHPYWPWSFAGEMGRVESPTVTAYLRSFARCLINANDLYTFGWLLPLALPRLRQVHRPWRLAVLFGFLAALAMGTYNDAKGNTSRAYFNVAGPLLSVAAAMLLVSKAGSPQRQETPTG